MPEFTFRPHHGNIYTPLFATDGVAWSVCVCLSVAVVHVPEPCKSVRSDRDAVWEADSNGPKEPRIRWGRDPHKKGQFWGLCGPLNSIGSLCCRVRSKRDHSVVKSSIIARHAMLLFVNFLWSLVKESTRLDYLIVRFNLQPVLR